MARLIAQVYLWCGKIPKSEFHQGYLPACTLVCPVEAHVLNLKGMSRHVSLD